MSLRKRIIKSRGSGGRAKELGEAVLLFLLVRNLPWIRRRTRSSYIYGRRISRQFSLFLSLSVSTFNGWSREMRRLQTCVLAAPRRSGIYIEERLKEGDMMEAKLREYKQ